ncbi:MAG: heavy metal-binding domain-containing protein [Planctomycetes bacterium]|nr:heavy metal-binding domain-containing protein [Planctomycetota bacterium]MCK5173469.1 heavy metal-binding domain-containing protein [Planctomycetota bacterium]
MGELIFQLFFLLGLLTLGYVSGKCIEISHLRRLAQQETALRDVGICNLRKIPPELNIKQSFLVTGSVVIATDYFKVFIAGLRGIFGGEMRTYRSLMHRARREALVRMLGEAKNYNAHSVWNVRFESATIQGKRKKKAGGVEVLVYGTAIIM